MTLESLARTIAKARHGTDAMWANYMPSARAAVEAVLEDAGWIDSHYYVVSADDLEALIAQPSGAQNGVE